MPRPNPAPVRDARFDMSKWAESDKGKAAKRVRVGEKKEGRKGEGRRAVPVEEEEEEEEEEDDREDEEEDEEDGGEEDEDEDEDDEDKDEQGEDEQDEGQEVEDDDDSANANDDDANDRQRTLDEIESNTHQPVLTAESLESYAKKQQKRGIVYVSRIPPGMTPAKVRHIFSQFGEVGRIYLQPKDKEKEKKRKRGTTHFSEGWIEYLSKRVARTAAEMMNAQPIGSLAGSAHSSRKSQTGSRVANRWKDDVWTMKYLKGFRWPMLIEQMSHERAAHAARLRMELAQSAHEQRDYLRKVERSRIQREKEERRVQRGLPQEPAQDTFTFQQRAPVYHDVRDQRARQRAPKQADPAMDQVLDQIL